MVNRTAALTERPSLSARPRLKEDHMQLPEVPLPTKDFAERHARERLRSMVVEHYVAPPMVDEGPALAGPMRAAAPPPPIPTPGARVFIYKQDPSVAEIAVRK